MKRQIALWAVLLLLLCAGCGKAAPGEKGIAANPVNSSGAAEDAAGTAEESAGAEESGTTEQSSTEAEKRESAAEEANETAVSSGDRVLASVNAAVDGTRTLRLDAIGRAHPERTGHYIVHKIEVSEDGKALQTVSISEARPDFPSDGADSPSDGAARSASSSAARSSHAARDADGLECASIKEAAAVLDVNFDGSDDLDLCEWVSSYASLHHYWTWNSAIGRYLYACTLQEPRISPLEKEVVSQYNTASAYYTDVYRPAPDGTLALASRELEDWDRGTEDFPLLERYEYPDGEETLVRQAFTDYDDAGRTIREIRELVDGELIPVLLEELEVMDGSIRVIRSEAVPPPQPEIPEEELWEEDAAS